MSVTAVPLRPLRKGSVLKLWLALGALSLGAGALAWAGTSSQQVATTASGLQFQTIEEGTGVQPTEKDLVLINYTGRLEDGTIFDSTEGKQPAALPVTGVIPGFTEGLKMMKKGGKYRLRIPSELAYGAEGAGGGVIPPNAPLTFEIELLEVAPASAVQGMMPPGGGM